MGGRKGTRPVKNRVLGCWRGYLSGARCRLAYMTQLMPLPLAVSCFSKIEIGFTFLVQAHPGSAGQRAFKWVCGVWVCLIQSVSRRTLGRPVHCLNASIIQSVTLAGGELRRRRGLPGHLLRNHTHYLYIGGFKGRWGHGCCHGISCVTWSRAVTQPTTFEVVPR